MRRTPRRYFWFVVPAQLLLPVGLIATADAHAAYESSDPADGASVSRPPSRVTADFTEPVIDDSRLEIYDPCGSKVDNGDSLVAADRITVTMSADKKGTYTVHFEVVSSVDGHPTSGDFSFSSSGGSDCAEEEDKTQDSSGGSGSGERSNRPTGASSAASGTSVASGKGTVERQQDGKRQPRARSDGLERSSGKARSRRGDAAASGDIALTDPGEVRGQEDIPVGGLIVALSIAALIGVVGGRIYVGILGPRA